MRIVRYSRGGQVSYGSQEGDTIRPITGDIFGQYEVTGESVPLSSVKLLAPIPNPSKVLAIALNYQSHLGERPQPKVPEPFYKPASAIVGPDDTVVLPKGAGRIDAEGELVVIIGRRCSKVSPQEAMDYVFGYTCGNDVSARIWQRNDIQWWRAKGSDTFAPLGPAIVTGLDPTKLELETRINGERAQYSPVSDLIYDVAECISFSSSCVTLEPGDLIYTGTPGTTQPLKKGDVVEVEISEIGVLRNPVDEEA
jgi:2-keto-4-pentenoate hydratase/2-oxohepta-3-ene-1,7-dioic acid hydratase in catechol pathway